MRVWCAQCKRVQHIIERRKRRRRVLEELAGVIGVCAICGYPVSAIGRARHALAEAVAPRPLAASA